MATPRQPRTRKPANTRQLDLVPVEPRRRRTPRQPPTYAMETRQPVQPSPRHADWVKTQVVDATVEELSKVSLADAATIIRAAIKGQPMAVAPVARRAVRRAGPSGSLVAVGAADPLNLVGILVPGPRVASFASGRIL